MYVQTSFLLPAIWKSQILLQSYKCLVYILQGLSRVEYVLQDLCWASFNSFSKALCTRREGAGRSDAVRLVMGMAMQTPTCVADTEHPVLLLLI